MTNHDLANPQLAACEVHGVTRGAFILRGALAAGAVYGTAAVGPFVSQAFAQTGGGDVDILNFALTLEYLEADFYTVKGKQVGLSGQAKAYATQFGEEEAAHVSALEAAIKQLGGTPVKKPKFSFPATSQSSFLALASVLENTGVGAYNGAAPSISSKMVLAAAGSIVQVEARHAAAINLLLGKSPTPTAGFDKPLTKKQVLAAAGPLIK
ncbi:MAG: ferritin-like domain-containing protein [Solirubrobacteraceae bacterium]|nr:MAG: twin-arginine translocation pathway signal [Solirubrobacterales bacterium]